jgi:hypothetical protein
MEGIDFHSHSTVIRAVNPHVNSAHTLVKVMTLSTYLSYYKFLEASSTSHIHLSSAILFSSPQGMEEIAATNLIDLVQVLKAAGDDDKVRRSAEAEPSGSYRSTANSGLTPAATHCSQVAELRKSMMSLLEARNSLLRHKQSLETLAVGQHTYRPTGAVTNFEEELLKREQEILARMP